MQNLLNQKMKDEGFIYMPNFYSKKIISIIEEEIQLKSFNVDLFFQGECNQKFITNTNLETSFAFENDTIKYLSNANFFFPSISKLINGQLLSTIETVTNNEVFLDRIELHQKLPGVSKTPPHQDNFYFGFDLRRNFAVTAYLALNKQEDSSGLLEFYPYSHKKNFDHNPSKVVGFSSGIKSDDLQGIKRVSLSLNPGDLIIHHCNIVHEAKANRSLNARSNIAFRFFPFEPIYDDELVKKYEKFRKSSIRTGNS